MPEAVCTCASLTSLNLSANSLVHLPPALGALQVRLAALCWLVGGDASQRDQESGVLHDTHRAGHAVHAATPQSLLHLDVSYNQLVAVSPQLGALTRLQHLNLSYNHLAALPPEVPRRPPPLTATQRALHLASSPPTRRTHAAPPAAPLAPHVQVGRLVSLQELRLNDNHLAALPAELLQLTALEVSDPLVPRAPRSEPMCTWPSQPHPMLNRRARVPPAAAEQVLHVQFNRLAALPAGLRQALPALTDLCCEGNPLARTKHAPGGASSAPPTMATASTATTATAAPGQSPARQQQQQPDVLILDGDGDVAASAEPRAPTRSPNKVAPSSPWQEASADEFIDLDAPGIDIVGMPHPSPRPTSTTTTSTTTQQHPGGGERGGGGTDIATSAIPQLVQLTLDDLQDLPPACAAVLYRSANHVQGGLRELQEGRPLTRGGTAGPGAGAALPPPPPSASGGSRSAGRPFTAAAAGRPGSAYRRPGSAQGRPATALGQRPGTVTAAGAGAGPGGGGGGASGQQQHWRRSGPPELVGVQALLTGPPRPPTASARPGTAAAGGAAPGALAARDDAGARWGSGSGGDTGEAGGLQALPAVTFPFTAGVRSMLRQLSGGDAAARKALQAGGPASGIGAPAADHGSGGGGGGFAAGEAAAGLAVEASPAGVARPNGVRSDKGGVARAGGSDAQRKEASGADQGSEEEEDEDDAMRTVRALLAQRNPALLQGLERLTAGEED